MLLSVFFAVVLAAFASWWLLRALLPNMRRRLLDQQLSSSEAHHPEPAAGQKGHSEHRGGGDVEAGNPGVGPAGLMKALEQVKTVGLKHPLPGKQTAGHAEEGVAEQRGGHQQQA